MKKVICNFCEGYGFTVVSGHGCDGDIKKCETHCPVPEQVVCEACHGTGYYEVEDKEDE